MTRICSISLDTFHEGLLNLWAESTENPFAQMVPMIYTEFRPDSLLFIGINPSFDPKAVVRVVKHSSFGDMLSNVASVNEYYRFNTGITERKLADLQCIQQFHKDKLAYYNRHKFLSSALNNIQWEHIDLFQTRHSVQKDLMDYLQGKSDAAFFEQQIHLFLQLLRTISPRVIVILNRTSGNILKRLFDKIDPELLTETSKDQFILTLDGKRIPLLISVHIRYRTVEEGNKINQQIVDFVQNTG